MTTTVETALGSIATSELGATLMHEHIVTRSPGVQENWPHLWDRAGILALAGKKMADLHARGIRAIVDLTTVDLGRDLDLIVQVARRSRVHVIVATGVWWMPQRYFSGHGVDEVAGLFIRENGLFMNPANKGRYYHDGRFKTLLDVVNHYNTRFSLGLTAQEKNDVVEYLKSLPEDE